MYIINLLLGEIISSCFVGLREGGEGCSREIGQMYRQQKSELRAHRTKRKHRGGEWQLRLLFIKRNIPDQLGKRVVVRGKGVTLLFITGFWEDI
jgi:hypothetical protein